MITYNDRVLYNDVYETYGKALFIKASTLRGFNLFLGVVCVGFYPLPLAFFVGGFLGGFVWRFEW